MFNNAAANTNATTKLVIPTWFNVRKAAQVVAFFALEEGGIIDVAKLTRNIYLADRQSLARREVSITDDDFIAMPFGPVNAVIYNLIQRSATEHLDIWSSYIDTRQESRIVVKTNVTFSDLDELSPYECELLENGAFWQDINPLFTLSKWAREYCPEWRNPGTTPTAITYAEIFRALGRDEPEALAAEITAGREWVTILNAR